MSGHTNIEWATDRWNPIVGCSVVSPGCTNCYAMRLAGTRLKDTPAYRGLTQESKAGPVWNGKVRLLEERLDDPLRLRAQRDGSRRRIFVNSMGDLFHENVPDEWIVRVIETIASAPLHNFLVLTKRAPRMREWFSRFNTQPLPNLWLGVSAEDQARANERIPVLLDTAATVRFVSYEPALGPIDASPYLERLDWLIVGAESGSNARPFRMSWARSIIAQCEAVGIPCFVKQLGRHPISDDAYDLHLHLRDIKGGDWSEWPADLRVRDYPTQAKIER